MNLRKDHYRCCLRVCVSFPALPRDAGSELCALSRLRELCSLKETKLFCRIGFNCVVIAFLTLKIILQLPTVDPLARASMKTVAKRDRVL